MKIKNIRAYRHQFKLTRPYKIAYKTHTTAENVIVEITTDEGKIGLGAASPSPEVTKETIDACLTSLVNSTSWCEGRNIDEFSLLKRECYAHLTATPAACAAMDIALHDLYAQTLNKPLVEVLGRVHHQLPTSITIGIKNVEETLQEAEEYISRGFKVLKVKLGSNLEEDMVRLIKLREHFTNTITIRVDPNQGYTLQDLIVFLDKTKELKIEFVEQPLKVSDTSQLYQLPKHYLNMIMLDESVLNAKDAIKMLTPSPCCGIFNIKLMKCGGIHGALQIASLAETSGIDLMWGCMDESIISITAALHAAFSSPATKYIDLDGSLDLENDVVTGGFHLVDGMMSTVDSPGLGVRKIG
ncbi:MAG: dipeptide epimerase [Gammaproteobacteria bacterium 39-13]|nr:dipeptide epimerase [Gammaproteobacteria bacterium]OJV96224.1 MAG: dipeptide epimerase [Gammaproteobacteria bacterium 39-13]